MIWLIPIALFLGFCLGCAFLHRLLNNADFKINQLRNKLALAYRQIDNLKFQIGHQRTDDADWWRK